MESNVLLSITTLLLIAAFNGLWLAMLFNDFDQTNTIDRLYYALCGGMSCCFTAIGIMVVYKQR
jgi:succinate dehydrogenase/fumarate reductase cytochrome b subunit